MAAWDNWEPGQWYPDILYKRDYHELFANAPDKLQCFDMYWSVLLTDMTPMLRLQRKAW